MPRILAATALMSMRRLYCLVLSFFGLSSFLPLFGAPQLGSAVAWGANSLLQTNVPSDFTNLLTVASGHYHSLGLRSDGTVVGWGDDNLGKATAPNGLSNVVAISAGAQHSLALRSNGRVVAWGDNSSGQTNVPANLSSVMAISAGAFHNLALRSNGTVVAWGTGSATNVPPNLVATAIAAGGNHSLALRADGTVAGWGQNTFGQANTVGLSQILGIAAGYDFSAYILNDRSVLARGNPALGRTSPPIGLSGVVALAAGGAHCLALKTDRRVVAWGDNSSGQASVPTNFSVWTRISAGFSHSAGVAIIPPRIVTQPESQTVTVGSTVNLSVGALGSPPLSYRWRRNGNVITGATGSSYSITNAQTTNSGNYTVIVTNLAGAITSSVAVVTVTAAPGIVTQPQSATVGLGWTNIFSVTASGSAPLRYRWRHAGTNIPNATNATYTNINVQHRHEGNYVVVITNNFGAITSATAVLTVIDPPLILTQPQSQVVVEGSSVSLSVLATNVDGYQWRKDGQAIDGANDAVYTIPSVRTDHAGQYSVFLTNLYGTTLSSTGVLIVVSRGAGPGEVVGWGESNIWDGFNYVDLTPPAISNVIAISAGKQHSIALFRNGMVLAWGLNTDGQASTPTGLSNVVQISAGGFHNVARTSGGSLLAWGLNDFQQSTIPPYATNIIAIAAGGYHTLGLRSDGTVVGWGKPTQSIPPPNVGTSTKISAGTEHSLSIRTNGTVAAWGANNLGQARPPADLSNVVAIAAGENHSLALRSDGTVVAWGANNLGQTNIPDGLSGVTAIACGANHCLALKSDYTVVAWGHDNFGQTEVPSNLPPVIAIAAGGDRSLALTRNLLQLSPPQRVPGNQVRVAVTTVDGGLLLPERAQELELYFSTNPALPIFNWTKLPQTISSQDGSWFFLDTATAPARFYITVERR